MCKLEAGTSARATFHRFHALQLVFSVAEQMQRRNFLCAGCRLRPCHTASLPQSRPEDLDWSSTFFLWSKSIFHEMTSAFPAPWTSRASACCRHSRTALPGPAESKEPAHDCEHMGSISFVIDWKPESFFLIFFFLFPLPARLLEAEVDHVH